MANGLLGMIANPAQADVLGAMDKGKQRQATDMAGEILGNTIGGQVGALAKLSPDKAMAMSQALGIPLDSKGRMNNMIGVSVMTGKLLDAGMLEEAAQFATEEADKIESLTGQEATRLLMVPDAIRTGNGEVLANFSKFARAMDPTLHKKGGLASAKIRNT